MLSFDLVANIFFTTQDSYPKLIIFQKIENISDIWHIQRRYEFLI